MAATTMVGTTMTVTTMAATMMAATTMVGTTMSNTSLSLLRKACVLCFLVVSNNFGVGGGYTPNLEKHILLEKGVR